MAESPKIYCSYTKLAEIDSLKPNPANPNRHPDSQVEVLSKLITSHGWRHPVTVSKRSGYIVSGHCRLLAALKLELRHIPIDEQDFASEAEELAVLVADNNIPELSETDGLKMADILCELDQQNYPLELTALTEDEIKNFIDGPGMPTDQDWADHFEQQGDTTTVDGLKQITFVLEVDNHTALMKHLQKFDPNKNEAIIKWLKAS